MAIKFTIDCPFRLAAHVNTFEARQLIQGHPFKPDVVIIAYEFDGNKDRPRTHVLCKDNESLEFMIRLLAGNGMRYMPVTRQQNHFTLDLDGDGQANKERLIELLPEIIDMWDLIDFRYKIDWEFELDTDD